MSDAKPMTEKRLKEIEAAAQIRSTAPLYAGEAQHMADLALELVEEVKRMRAALRFLRVNLWTEGFFDDAWVTAHNAIVDHALHVAGAAPPADEEYLSAIGESTP